MLGSALIRLRSDREHGPLRIPLILLRGCWRKKISHHDMLNNRSATRLAPRCRFPRLGISSAICKISGIGGIRLYIYN